MMSSWRIEAAKTLVAGAILAAALPLSTIGTAGAQQIAAGVTCADVRKLTSVERWYWRKRLGLTDEQVRAIRKQCGLK